MPAIMRNPILPGFYPDPSICRVGADYYLVNSTFEYFPGLPIFHSRDLVHWRQIGHVLDRPSQLPLDGVRPSGGLYAPTIRHRSGVFYVINTLVDGQTRRGNFIVSATNPAGPWSEPVWLDDAPGIDPSLFFDDDGRVWYVGQRLASPGLYEGHSEIWLQELDLAAMRLIGDKQTLWSGALHGAIWAEGPHLYKIQGRYYLMIAEGGTGHDHAVTIARSNHVSGPYESYTRNPILTHRHLGRDYPIACAGHADLVDTLNGEWWMVLLATRPYGGNYYNLGRETFLAPVRWEDGWPTISPGSGKIEWEYPAPDLPAHPWPTLPACDHFDAPTLAFCWNMLRAPREEFWSLAERPGFLRLRLRPQMLTEFATPSFIGRRQQHINFAARTVMDFTPDAAHECAGMVLLQNNDFHFRMVVTQTDAHAVIRVIKREKGRETILAEQPAARTRHYLKIEAVGQEYGFYFAATPEVWQPLAERADGRILSPQIAGGFVGTYVGMYASSNGQVSANYADFDWFEYQGA
ncbi:glycoside hydrolase family 43 [Candidatus Moduliflexus flocculans]|uniref:Glycoside hydrolase family 43 n=1 Tax=Candidatus Moduliflexus flocculans TaxID=1499966 RepID=A0A081BP93_9BACT|nr:glycoside hydrolase family 43 [Candidatus Moduliflexus flocculans]